jgi:ketosteroid isomerase-like protein
MSNEATNVATLKEAYHQWHESRGGSVKQLLSICDPGITWGSIPRGKPPLDFAKQYESRDALQAYFDGLLNDWSMIHYTIDEYIAQADAVVARGSTSWKNKKTGKVMDTPKVDFWRFRNGKAVEFYEYFDTAHVMAAAAS